MPTITEAVQANQIRIGMQQAATASTLTVPLAAAPLPPALSPTIPSGSNIPAVITGVSTLPTPISPVIPTVPTTPPISSTFAPVKIVTVASQQATAGNAAGQATNPKGVPAQILSGTVSQEAYDSGHILASVAFVPTADPFFGGVNIWLVGYHKNVNPVLVAGAKLSPISFVLDLTGELVTVVVQAVSPSGVTAELSGSPRAAIVLNGAFPAPPPPTIVQTTIPIGGGFQFQFTFESGNLAAQVTKYNVYRSQTANDFSTTRLLTTVAQSTGTETFQDLVTGAAYYFLSAVDVNGHESSIVSCQSGAIAASSKIDPSSTQILTKGTLGLNGSTGFTYTSNGTSITWSWTGLTIYRTDGTLTSIPNGSQPITGLTGVTTYYFYPYYSELTKTLQWVAGGSGTPAYAQVAPSNVLSQAQNLQHLVALSIGGMSAATTSGGGGGGSGGGGGGGCCEVGTQLLFPPDSTVFLDVCDCFDWVELVTESGRHLAVALNTLVSTFKRAQLLEVGDTVEVGTEGAFEKIIGVSIVKRNSQKMSVRVIPQGTYYGNGVRLHNMKAYH